MLLATQVDWEMITKAYGPLGVIFVIAVLGVVAGGRMARNLVLGALDDARKERDYARLQREKEVERFIGSLEKRDQLMREGFDEILGEIRAPRRK